MRPPPPPPTPKETLLMSPSNPHTLSGINCHVSPVSTPVKTKAPGCPPLKRPRVRSLWGTHRSTTEQEVIQCIHKLGCKNLRIERRTSTDESGKRQTWRFMVLGEEADIYYLEENWKSMPERWELCHPDKNGSGLPQGCPFQEHLPRRPPIQTGITH